MLSSAFVTRSEALITYDTQLDICYVTAQEVPQFSTLTVGFPIDQVVVTGELTGDLQVISSEG